MRNGESLGKKGLSRNSSKNNWNDYSYSRLCFSPVDIIPDVIPVLGLVDDATMVGLCIAASRSDIEDFRIWARSYQKLLK